MAYAHSRNSLGVRHDLADHLQGVASLAASFAEKLGASDAGHWAGLWHDIGKFHPSFQQYLFDCEANPNRKRTGPDHKGAGTILARDVFGPLAFLIAGHHGGLPGRDDDLRPLLVQRANEPHVQEALAIARASLANLVPTAPLAMPELRNAPTKKDTARAFELLIRLLFSALVDADFLDTEQHFSPHKTDLRGGAPSLEELWARLESNQTRLSGQRDDPVNRIRHEVYHASLAAAEQAPGIFRLTVPTGGGKTRSAMAFALRHALIHGLDRVIVAIPYTSITEQTARVYREIFGAEHAVLEHHSAVSDRDDSQGSADADWTRLSAENWDAPIVVTTTVQLFESLLGRKPSACRKLHNIARSVIILDEAQTLPPHLLTPILDVLGRLASDFRTTVVLCTATQPAFEAIPAFAAFAAPREIAPDPPRLFAELRRVRYEWPAAGERWSWEQVAEAMRSAPQALAIVNTKRDALALLDALDDPQALHLSTLLCGAHRHAVLEEVRDRLRRGAPCCLVSTQVVEAGVDLDFPLVLRALGPLDRIVQAAGRCNREGLLAAGRMIVFIPAEGGLPPGAYRIGADLTAALIKAPDFDFDAPAVYETYFRSLYQGLDLDAQEIQALRETFDYPEVANRFRMIEDDSTPAVVPYHGLAETERLLGQLRGAPGASRGIFRQLQPFLVSIRTRQASKYQQAGLMEEVLPGLWRWRGDYDRVRGIVAKGFAPEELVI